MWNQCQWLNNQLFQLLCALQIHERVPEQRARPTCQVSRACTRAVTSVHDCARLPACPPARLPDCLWWCHVVPTIRDLLLCRSADASFLSLNIFLSEPGLFGTRYSPAVNDTGRQSCKTSADCTARLEVRSFSDCVIWYVHYCAVEGSSAYWASALRT